MPLERGVNNNAPSGAFCFRFYIHTKLGEICLLKGKVLITGITGSLGTAIIERATRENWPVEFTGIARNETKMNQFRQRFPHVRGEIGDVRDKDWLTTIFPGHNLIIHAAAIKIVPVAEANPREAVLTNVVGSLNVAQAATDIGIEKVVGISTDKACGPTYYGLTKRLMEGIFRQARGWGDTQFVICRYGNVLGSNNSIVPLLMKQIAEDKPFTITDKRMSRFWLSMDQAIDLIITTNTLARNGEIYVPKAPAMLVYDLMKVVDPNREIVETGIRAGERLHESLIVREEAIHTESTDNMFVIRPPEETVDSFLAVPFQYEYTSNAPKRWIQPDEMKKMIEES